MRFADNGAFLIRQGEPIDTVTKEICLGLVTDRPWGPRDVKCSNPSKLWKEGSVVTRSKSHNNPGDNHPTCRHQKLWALESTFSGPFPFPCSYIINVITLFSVSFLYMYIFFASTHDIVHCQSKHVTNCADLRRSGAQVFACPQRLVPVKALDFFFIKIKKTRSSYFFNAQNRRKQLINIRWRRR